MADNSENSELYNIMCWEFERKLDSQSRFAVPSEWRSGQDAEVYVLIPGKDHTLQMYTNAVFQERFMEKFKSLSPAKADEAKKIRQLC